MTNYEITTLDIPSLYRHSIGFDRLLQDLNKTFTSGRTDGNYPPHNVIRIDDDHYIIEMAVAGFSDDELNIELDKNLLQIRGEKTKTEDQPEYTYKGISSKSFTREFPLAEHVEVRSADVKNGILSIALERLVPEEAKPKKIAITFAK